jgi:uncharacterized repeat protein (TIGR03803 family)
MADQRQTKNWKLDFCSNNNNKSKRYPMKIMFRQMTLVMATLFLAAASAPAATFTNLYSFSALSPTDTNEDGSSPLADLVSSGSTLYGAAADGGTNTLGTVFSINTDGQNFTNLHNFDYATNGSGPSAALVLSGNMLYGTTRAGGSNGLGTVFAISTNGTGFVRLHDFGSVKGEDPATQLNTNSGGAFPETDLVLSNNTLYGATEQGGSGGNGTLFKINTSGSGFTLLHNFTNADGGYPSVHMVLAGTNLFGTTQFGGSVSNTGSGSGYGTVFRVGTNGLGFTNLYNFTASAYRPIAGLVLSSNMLYGTTALGSGGPGNAPYGSVFMINTNGTGFTNFYILDPELGAGDPSAGLAIYGNTIFATELGFDAYGGTVFQVNTDGTGYTNLTSFNSPGDPGTLSGLVFSGGALYGTAWSGGANGNGVVFAVTLFPTLNIQLLNKAVVLSWNDPSFSLAAAPALNAVFTNIAGATSPYTNAIMATQQFFHLQ